MAVIYLLAVTYRWAFGPAFRAVFVGSAGRGLKPSPSNMLPFVEHWLSQVTTSDYPRRSRPSAGVPRFTHLLSSVRRSLLVRKRWATTGHQHLTVRVPTT